MPQGLKVLVEQEIEQKVRDQWGGTQFKNQSALISYILGDLVAAWLRLMNNPGGVKSPQREGENLFYEYKAVSQL